MMTAHQLVARIATHAAQTSIPVADLTNRPVVPFDERMIERPEIVVLEVPKEKVVHIPVGLRAEDQGKDSKELGFKGREELGKLRRAAGTWSPCRCGNEDWHYGCQEAKYKG